jgi:primary-amine oxidase
VKADRALDQTDVVLWYSVGSHHISRPEEWPVMPVSYAGFQLKPAGFFVGSPALDVPATSHNGHAGAPHCH